MRNINIIPIVEVEKISNCYYVTVACNNGSSIKNKKWQKIEKLIYVPWNRCEHRPFNTRDDAEQIKKEVLQILAS